MASENRARLYAAPLGTSPALGLLQPGHGMLAAAGLCLIAEGNRAGQAGWIVQNRAGEYGFMTPLADPEPLPSQKVLGALDVAGMDMAELSSSPPAGLLDTDIRRRVSEMMLAWREAHGLTQKEAAGYTDIPLQTWRKWERMERTCPYPRLMALALLYP